MSADQIDQFIAIGWFASSGLFAISLGLFFGGKG